jgi:methyl-accepting chemotaxis protein
MIIMGLLAVAISVAAALVITRGLLKQLGGEPDYTASIAGSIANGDLSDRSTPTAATKTACWRK